MFHARNLLGVLGNELLWGQRGVGLEIACKGVGAMPGWAQTIAKANPV